MARCIVLLFAVAIAHAEPLSPADELKTFRTLPGFKVELVAAEPDVVDPVAMCFDERARLFVCEMRGYPNAGTAKGQENRGRVRCLTDKDGDGRFESSVVYADGLRFPTGVLPWRGGLIVCNAPDLIYLTDADNDGKADKSQVLYTGFGLDNIQQILNSPRWSPDGWVHCVVGSVGGTITCPEKPDMPPLVLRGGRGIRFRPETPGKIEPTSGGGQYGLTCDEAGHWFTSTNSQMLRQIVLPEHYLARNPAYAAPATTADINEGGSARRIFRISEFEPWRVERTTRRKEGPDAKRFAANELVPGGYITSACSPCWHDDPPFPDRDRRCVYVCDPANNLITRDKMEPHGSIFKGKRIDDGVEFLASTDNWFRPVHLTVGPEGALYVLDFYREAIETPLSLPDDIKKRLNLETRNRGRIWRIVPEEVERSKWPNLAGMKLDELVAELSNPHEWRRSTALRLLRDKPAAEVRQRVPATDPDNPAARIARLHALASSDGLRVPELTSALRDKSDAVRIVAMRLAEPALGKSKDFGGIFLSGFRDASSPVRLQIALSHAMQLPGKRYPSRLIDVLRDSASDPWLVSASLLSVQSFEVDVLEMLTTESDPAPLDRIERMAALAATSESVVTVARLIDLASQIKTTPLAGAVLEGVRQGSRNGHWPIARLLASDDRYVQECLVRLGDRFREAKRFVSDSGYPEADRVAAVRLLAFAPLAIAGPALVPHLSAESSPALRSAALQSLADHDSKQADQLILAGWSSFTPTTRAELVGLLTRKPERIMGLLDAVEAKKILPAHLESARIKALRDHPDPVIRLRSNRLLQAPVGADRAKIIADYKPALALKGDADRGREVFRKNCTACHRLEDVGKEVGASLSAALGTKTKEAMLIDILDPSREVDPRFVVYEVRTKNERLLTGILAVETSTSLTLRRAEGVEETVLRSQVEEIRAGSKSLMPDELEKVIDKQQLADLLAYLKPG